jgi:hypothetical protein
MVKNYYFCNDMKFKILILLLSILFPMSLSAFNNSGLDQLNEALEKRGVYQKKHLLLIKELKRERAHCRTTEQIFVINNKLAEAYKNFCSDSAFVYLSYNKTIARQMHNDAWACQSNLLYAYVLASVGLYNEAYDLLDSLQEKTMTPQVQLDYYNVWVHYYDDLRHYVVGNPLEEIYQRKLYAFYDSIAHRQPAGSALYAYCQARKAWAHGEEALSFSYLEQARKLCSEPSELLSAVYYGRGRLAESRGQNDSVIYYYALAAATDVKCAVNSSHYLLWLAEKLHQAGDKGNSFRYAQASMFVANEYSSQLSLSQVAHAMPIIRGGYEWELTHYRQTNTILIFLVIAAVCCLAFLVWKNHGNGNWLARVLMQTRQPDAGSSETAATQASSDSASRHTNEVYVGGLMDISLKYIERLEDYQKLVRRKVKAGQYSDLLRDSVSEREKDEAEIYAKFDSAFLGLYPDFVEKLNKMLKPDERYSHREGSPLSTDLRIMALIYFGITDNARIANFLGYSIRTIYNYRSQFRKKTLSEDLDIEQAVRSL